MNHSIHSADSATHLKIVVVALVAGIAVAAFGISARTGTDYNQTAHVVKASKVITSPAPTLRSYARISRAINDLEYGRPRAAFALLGICEPDGRGWAIELMARETGLEPAASAVTGRRSNQLSYSRGCRSRDMIRVRSDGLKGRP